MNTYALIITKILNIKNNIFMHNYKPDGVDCIFKFAFSILLNNQINSVNKFTFFYDTLQNVFFKYKQNEFIHYFYKIQRTYNALNKLAYNYKRRKSKIVIDTDMLLNKLTTDNPLAICIFHNGATYLFHINDLIKIITASLTNADMFFSKPVCIKNPYNNLPFTKAQLYNIYFFIKYKTHLYSDLFFNFFKCNFNLSFFKNNYEPLLREYIIYNYVYKSPSNVLIEEIVNMIEIFNDYCANNALANVSIEIDADFPKNILIKIMQPYLLLFCTSQFAFLHHIKKEALYFFKKSLIAFAIFNPKFGRKKYKILIKHDTDFNKRVCGKIIEFDDKHIKFNNISKQDANFLSDHLICNEQTIHNEIVRDAFFNFIGNEQPLEEDSSEDEEELEEEEGFEDEEGFEEDGSMS